MTKLWCPLCHKSAFAADPPVQWDVSQHLLDAHGYQQDRIRGPRQQQAIRDRQDEEWERVRRELSERLDAEALRMQDEYEFFVNNAGMKHVKVPGGKMDEALQREWMELMEVEDDGVSEDEGEFIDEEGRPIFRKDRMFQLVEVMQPEAAAGGRRPTTAQRSASSHTVVEKKTSSGVRLRKIIPPSEKDVGWDRMATSGYVPGTSVEAGYEAGSESSDRDEIEGESPSLGEIETGDVIRTNSSQSTGLSLLLEPVNPGQIQSESPLADKNRRQKDTIKKNQARSTHAAE